VVKGKLFIVMLLAAAAFYAVAAVGWIAVDKLHATSKKLVVDTLPSLADAGLAQERFYQNRHLMHEMLDEHTPAERAQLIQFVTSNSTDGIWKDYADTIYSAEERQLYETMLVVRSNYSETLPPFLNLVAAGKISDASTLFNGEQNRRFQIYRAAAQRVFDFNARQGVTRGKIISSSLPYAPLVVGGLCLLVFVFGFSLGLRLAFMGGSPRPRSDALFSQDREPGQRLRIESQESFITN